MNKFESPADFYQESLKDPKLKVLLKQLNIDGFDRHLLSTMCVNCSSNGFYYRRQLLNIYRWLKEKNNLAKIKEQCQEYDYLDKIDLQSFMVRKFLILTCSDRFNRQIS